MKSFVDSFRGLDLNFVGPNFTWNGNWERTKWICQRLDIVICSSNWFTTSGSLKVGVGNNHIKMLFNIYGIKW